MIGTLRKRLWGKSQENKTAITLDATQAARQVAKYDRDFARGDKPKPLDEDFLASVVDVCGWTSEQWDAQVAYQAKLLDLAVIGHPEKVEATRQRAAELAEAHERAMKSEETRHRNVMVKLQKQYQEVLLANHEHNQAVTANNEVQSKVLITTREKALIQQVSDLSPKINDLCEHLRFATNGLAGAKAELTRLKSNSKNTPPANVQKQEAHVSSCQQTVDTATNRLKAARKQQDDINDELRGIRQREVEAVFSA